MSDTRLLSFSGGCQCGAVRFVCEQIMQSSICHCRMCQKAFAAPYGAFVGVDQFELTRGKPKIFRSSNKAVRGFCENCGTQLFVSIDKNIENIEKIAICALDDPEEFLPTIQFCPEHRIPWCDDLCSIPVLQKSRAAFAKYRSEVISFQHPDHDTAHWPPEPRP